MRRTAFILLLLLSLVLTGCGGSSEETTGGTGSGGQVSGATAAPSGGTASGATDCPTEATRRFAKTRFVADVGGAAFLIRRYVYQPYQAGTFQRGAPGRRRALLKAAAASAASAKLLSNASENAKADPVLCRNLAGPLASLTRTLEGLRGSLTTGRFDPALVGGLGGAVSGLLESSGDAGVPVRERPTQLS